MASYTRKQILLKREDGAPSGFLRMEMVDNRCDVEVHVEAKDAGLTALLLDGERVFPLGKISRNRTIHAPRIDEMDRYNRAAILSGDTLLFVGGDGADFKNIQKALDAQALAAREKKAMSITPEWEWKQPEPLRADSATAPPSEAAFHAEAMHAQALDPLEPPPKPTPPSDGWAFTPCHMGTIQCYAGHLTRGGRSIAKMHAVAGAYDTEPPPGLTGFVWDSGYWIKVAEGS